MEDNKVETKEVEAPSNIGVPPKKVVKNKEQRSMVNPMSIILLLVIVGGAYYLIKNKK